MTNWNIEVLRVLVQGIVLVVVVGCVTFLEWNGKLDPAATAILATCGTTAGTAVAITAIKANGNGNGKT